MKLIELKKDVIESINDNEMSLLKGGACCSLLSVALSCVKAKTEVIKAVCELPKVVCELPKVCTLPKIEKKCVSKCSTKKSNCKTASGPTPPETTASPFFA